MLNTRKLNYLLIGLIASSLCLAIASCGQQRSQKSAEYNQQIFDVEEEMPEMEEADDMTMEMQDKAFAPAKPSPPGKPKPTTTSSPTMNTMKKDMQQIGGATKREHPSPNNSRTIPHDTPQPDVPHNTEAYNSITENNFEEVTKSPLSTFSIDVDAASYSNARRFINGGSLPPANAVRIEEFVNYFSYDYPQPTNQDPFSINTEIAKCPWNQDHFLVHIGLQGKKIDFGQLPPNNLVFLLDVSGSMNAPNKLPLLKKAIKMLSDEMRPIDKVAIVVYAGAAGLVLPPTPFSQKETILAAINKLNAGGSTAGGEGIELAYKVAQNNFIKNGNNRIILATDGDFNIGSSSDADMVKLIEEKRKSGVYLTVLGFGMGNYKDSKMELLADKGNGNYAYIDSELEAKKVLVNEIGATLYTIAKDVKIQVEFNPAKIKAYRLIGYENRKLAARDFNDDTKDAGELGSGHTVTALYELIPAGSKETVGSVDDYKYQSTTVNKDAINSNELMTIKFRYKPPKSDKSLLITHPVKNEKIGTTSNNFDFSAAVAAFGMLLRNSQHKGTSDYKLVKQLAQKSLGKDTEGYRKAFIELVNKAEKLK
mgnify:CR=1 FL=1